MRLQVRFDDGREGVIVGFTDGMAVVMVDTSLQLARLGRSAA